MMGKHNQSKITTILTLLSLSTTTTLAQQYQYGVDVSFPIHHGPNVSTNYAWLPHNVDPENNPTPVEYLDMPITHLPGRQEFYEDFMRGCMEYYGKRAPACIETEKDRFAMSLRQPKSMVNYTDTGFKKIKAPEKLFNLLTSYWDKNKDNKKEESWGTGSTYVNSWSSPTHMVSVEDTSLRGGGYALKKQIWDAAQSTIEEWTGNDVVECSLYGIRVYTEGAVLAPHVDRNPLVSSAIINVAQDVDEEWPLEIYGRDGMAYNVTMEPGDMVLYESHSLIHGRPFALKGRFYANIFIHFEPVRRKGDEGMEVDEDGMPMYILEGSEDAEQWIAQHPDGKRTDRSKPLEFSTGSTAAHIAAQQGDLATLQKLASSPHGKQSLTKKDTNGWQPLHEASRAGHTAVIKLLVENGANVNERTHFDKGATALWWAEQEHGRDHAAVTLLRSLGGVSIPEEL